MRLLKAKGHELVGKECDATLGEPCKGVPTYEEVHDDVQDPFMWRILKKVNAIGTLHRCKELKGRNTQGVSALITLPTSLSRD